MKYSRQNKGVEIQPNSHEFFHVKVKGFKIKQFFANFFSADTNLLREVPGGTGKHQEVPGGTGKYQEVPGDYREVPGSTRRYREVPE